MGSEGRWVEKCPSGLRRGGRLVLLFVMEQGEYWPSQPRTQWGGRAGYTRGPSTEGRGQMHNHIAAGFSPGLDTMFDIATISTVL